MADHHNVIDWDAARRRLGAARQALQGSHDDDQDAVLETLRKRAVALAHAHQAADKAAQPLEVVVFRLAGERWALPATSVLEVRALSEVTPLPCTPSHVRAVMALRERILAVLDLRRLFNLPGRALSDRSCALVLGDGVREFAVLGEAVLGLEQIDAATLDKSVPGLGGPWRELILGLTPDGTTLIDASRLLTEPRLVVDARPGGGKAHIHPAPAGPGADT